MKDFTIVQDKDSWTEHKKTPPKVFGLYKLYFPSDAYIFFFTSDYEKLLLFGAFFHGHLECIIQVILNELYMHNASSLCS